MLGVQLVKCSSSEFLLTDAGKQFLSAESNILADWDLATEAVRLRRDGIRGPIRVAAPVAAGQTVLARIAARFLLKYPAVSIDWRLIDEPGDLAAGGYDLWIRAGPIQNQSLIVRDLWRGATTPLPPPRPPPPPKPAQPAARPPPPPLPP